MLPLGLVAAIGTQDSTPLRAAAKETAAKQTLLYAGDWLELRGERPEFVVARCGHLLDHSELADAHQVAVGLRSVHSRIAREIAQP